MNKYPTVFKPIKIGNLEIKNRIHFAPVVPCLATADGVVTDALVEFIGFQARTGVGYITIGDTQIDHERASCFGAELNVTSDKYFGGLSLLTEEAHRYGCKLSIELSHGGRGAAPIINKLPAYCPSNLPIPGCNPHIKVMDRNDMDDVINKWVDCVLRCKRAGFDMIMIHSAHNNLLGQFLSPVSNHRTDEYGGSLENRMRFPLEVFRKIREAVGPNYPLEARVSASEMTTGGLQFEESLEFIKQIQKYIDLLCVSNGDVFNIEGVDGLFPAYLKPHMVNVKYSEKIKEAIDIPVQVVGKITNLEEAEKVLSEGKADIVGIARSLCTGPDMIHNAIKGEEYKTRPCLKCNRCVEYSYVGAPIRCAVNPTFAKEHRYRFVEKAKEQKDVYVIGSGPAGMQAVETLLQRGHKVTLIEKEGRLGGKLYDASALPFKSELREYNDWAIRRTEASDVNIRLNTTATKEMIMEEKPDVVIVATGANYSKPNIPGINNENVHGVHEVDNGSVKVGNKVVVCGGGLSGVESALQLARDGKDVTVVDMIPAADFCGNIYIMIREALMSEVRKAGVKFIGNSKIKEFNNVGVVIEDKDGNTVILPADDAVVALGLKSENSLYKELLEVMPADVYLIGDGETAKTIEHATTSAFNVAVEI